MMSHRLIRSLALAALGLAAGGCVAPGVYVHPDARGYGYPGSGHVYAYPYAYPYAGAYSGNPYAYRWHETRRAPPVVYVPVRPSYDDHHGGRDHDHDHDRDRGDRHDRPPVRRVPPPPRPGPAGGSSHSRSGDSPWANALNRLDQVQSQSNRDRHDTPRGAVVVAPKKNRKADAAGTNRQRGEVRRD